MGCDFYEIEYLAVVCKDDDHLWIELRRTPHWVDYELDSDNFSNDEAYCNAWNTKFANEMDRIKAKNSPKVLYENGGWTIKNNKNTQRYRALIEEHCSFLTVTSITKCIRCDMRR